MNFFRLRVINTFLLFLIGIVAGFILKDRFYPQAPKAAPYAAAYKPSYLKAEDAGETGAEEEPAETFQEEEPAPKPEPAPRTSVRAETLEDGAGGENGIVIEPVSAPRAKKSDVVRGAMDDFFKRPESFAGRELEMDLQMITAKKSTRGWRLNFVYTAPDRHIDYLYADDNIVLGENPDLRIGYIYSVRFLCGKGETASGNVLSALSPTGGKADWATGLSAIE